tara:strand:- start:5 stop:373 length:369 start_codon:yes stop_codon:yes gene_type:complete
MKYLLSFFFIFCLLSFQNNLISQNSYQINIEHIRNGEAKIEILDAATSKKLENLKQVIPVKINNTEEDIPFFEGETILNINPEFKLCFLSMNINEEISNRLFYIKKSDEGTTYHDIPLWLSI